MQIKHNITPTGYPLLHFNSKLTKTASLRHIKQQNKQNLNAYQSRRRLQPLPLINNQNSSLVVNMARNYDAKPRALINSLQYQSNNSQSQKLLGRPNMLKSVEEKCSLVSIKSLRTKSVKFNDHNIVMPSVQSSVNLQKELTRKRSGSILKPSRVHSVSSSQQFKNKSLLKSSDSKLGSIFTINEYKNTLVREKYNQLLRTFNRNQENCLKMSMSQKLYLNKYTDTNFPPTSASISRTKMRSDIGWARISQLFADKNIVLFRNSELLNRVRAQQYGNQQFAAAIKLIGQSKVFLNRIFQNSVFNQMGVYMLKIFHQNEWKCVIVDDYIPIARREESKHSRFLFTSVNSQDKEVEIWPLIFEKAYASVVGSYQKLHNCDLMGYIVQMMGLPLTKLKISGNKEYKMDNQILEKADIFFGLKKNKTTNILERLVILGKYQQDHYGQETIQVHHYSKNALCRVNLHELYRDIDELYFLKTASLQNCATTNIGNSINIGKKIKNKRFFKQAIEQNQKEFIRQKSIIKSFVVPSSQQISFLLKFKQNTDNQRQVYWLRVILVMKQYDGYRWIDGKYAPNSISFSSYLEAGQYYLIILPDWTQTYQKEMSLITYSRINKIELKNYMENGQQKMIEKGCADYAQRKGKLIQINKYICAYTIIDQDAGLIIENINNERRSGNIKIFRNIQNIKPKESYLLPYNKEFYVSNHSLNNQIAVAVEKEESYSVILMQFGGNDQVFMDSFSFGP